MTSSITKRARLMVSRSTAVSLCVVLNKFQTVATAAVSDTFRIGSKTIEMHNHHSSGSSSDSLFDERIVNLKREMRKLGYVLHDVNDCELYWDGERCEPSMEEGIDTYDDHRMALSFAPFAMKSGRLIINNPKVVTKSYPGFWQSMVDAGFSIEVKSEK